MGNPKRNRIGHFDGFNTDDVFYEASPEDLKHLQRAEDDDDDDDDDDNDEQTISTQTQQTAASFRANTQRYIPQAQKLTPNPGQIAMYRQIRQLLALWQVEPFYFREISGKYKEMFGLCANTPIEEIVFEPQDQYHYDKWLRELVESNSGNYNNFPHLSIVAAAEGMEDLMQKFIDKGIRLDLVDVKGNNALNLANMHGHTKIEQMINEKNAGCSSSRNLFHHYNVGPSNGTSCLIPNVSKLKTKTLDF